MKAKVGEGMVCVGARERGDDKMLLFYLLPDGGGWARHNQSTVAEPLERAVPMIMRKLKVIYGINVAADVYRM